MSGPGEQVDSSFGPVFMTVQPFSLERVKKPLQQFGFAFLRERLVNPADANEEAAQTDGGILV